MASSTSTGDRRWSTARRGGMTVLGKVAVPKPINLPSQRLENHGLDPNVEIVPKGTFGWGSRPSSSTSNPWGSSSVSPNADSSSNSPNRVSAQLSSGEAGTRPLTAGSDKIYESTTNAWNSNSRPSSASGALTSSHASPTSLRPRSAEPRPGSSHLSRFAEPLSDIAVAGNEERLFVTSTKDDGFSLSTGDFPTLGSVRSISDKNDLHDSGCADGETPDRGRAENYNAGEAAFNTDGKNGGDDSWMQNNPPHSEGGHRVGNEKWNGDNPSYQNSGILPQQLNAWRGPPPVNNRPVSVWYRGPPVRPSPGPSVGPLPYGRPVAQGGFTMEHFQYYRPQIPPSALSNPQVPLPGTDPRGPPNSRGMYRPQVLDGYIRPGMPIRPGFCPGPVPYDGYFGPPSVGYCGSNERDLSILGMAGGPPSLCGQFPGQNCSDVRNSQIRPPRQGPNNNFCSSEEVESRRHRDPREPYRVLLKQHDNWNERNEEKKDDSQKSSGSSVEKVDCSQASSRGSGWRVDHGRDGEKNLEVEVFGGGGPPNFDGGAGCSVSPSKVKLLENHGSAGIDGSPARDEQKKFGAPDCPKSVASNDSSLIQKIEGLNAKARASDHRPDITAVVHGNKWQVNKTKSSHSAAKAEAHALHPENVSVASGLCSEEKILDGKAVSYPDISRRYPQSGQGKFHHRGRGRFNSENADGYRKKPAVSEPLLPTPLGSSDVDRQTHLAFQSQKDEDRYATVISSPGYNQAELACMKEQRLKQKPEEEERTRDKKAQASKISGELNKRSQVATGSNLKKESGTPAIAQNLQTPIDNKRISSISASSSCTPAISGDLITQTTDAEKNSRGTSSDLLKDSPGPGEPSKVVNKVSAVDQSVPIQQDIKTVAGSLHSHKHHHNNYKQKQNIMPERSDAQKIVSEVSKTFVDVADDMSTAVNVEADHATHQRRRITRGHRHKPRGDEIFPSNPLPSIAPKEGSWVTTASSETVKLKKASESGYNHSAAQTFSESNDESQLLGQHLGSAHEEDQIRGNSQWKSQHSRGAPRNQQLKRAADKFHGGDATVWAPVQSQNKAEVSDESSVRNSMEAQSSSVRSDQPLQNNNPRSRRAEMERYVPKPVAKEMAQQGTAHQQIAVLEGQKKIKDEAVQHGDSGFSSVAVKESRNADSRGNITARGHGSWRQRGSTDIATPQGILVEPPQSQSAPMGEPAQKRPEQHQEPKPEGSSLKEQPKHHEEGFSRGGNVQAEFLNSASQATAPAVKDQVITARGKRQPHLKGLRGDLDHDHKKSSGEKGDIVSMKTQGSHTSPTSEGGQTDTAAHDARESHGVMERTTLHWQPKSRSVSGQNVRANMVDNGGWDTADSAGFPMEEVPKKPVKDKMHDEAGEFEGSKRERRPLSGSANEPRDLSRFTRGDEYHGDWNSSRQHNVLANRDRRRQSSNYKYQPIGMCSNQNKPGILEGDGDGSQTTGPRYKERADQRTYRRNTGVLHERQGGDA